MTETAKPTPGSTPDADRDQTPQDLKQVVNAADLFRGQREICIELDGVCYRLRITRRNKLILQK